jgi:hypothetical protein
MSQTDSEPALVEQDLNIETPIQFSSIEHAEDPIISFGNIDATDSESEDEAQEEEFDESTDDTHLDNNISFITQEWQNSGSASSRG